MKRLSEYLREYPKQPYLPPVEPTPTREVTKRKIPYYPDDPEEIARAEVFLKSQAGRPECKADGTILYKCQVCKDMRWLRADVPLAHKLFGKMRPCPCNPQYIRLGPAWQ